MSLNKFFLFFLFLTVFTQEVSADTKSEKAKTISFPKNGVRELKVSTPKGKIEVLFDSKARDFKISINQLSGTQNKDEKKCVVETGLKGESLVVSISSENILFDKATCDYDVKVIAPTTSLMQTNIKSGTADIKVLQVDNDL